ncbi:hypothetical protein M9458_006364, partial [Cirrhinus mrigala]
MNICKSPAREGEYDNFRAQGMMCLWKINGVLDTDISMAATQGSLRISKLISDSRPRKWRPTPAPPERHDGDCRSSNSCQGNLTIGTCWDAVPEYG